MWYAFSSATTNIGVLSNPPAFLGTDGPRTIFSIECMEGRSIAQYSAYGDEVACWAGMGCCMKVVCVICVVTQPAVFMP